MKLIFKKLDMLFILPRKQRSKIMKKICTVFLVICCLIITSFPTFAQDESHSNLAEKPLIGTITNMQSGATREIVFQPVKVQSINSINSKGKAIEQNTLTYEANVYSITSDGRLQEPGSDKYFNVKYVLGISFDMALDKSDIRLVAVDGSATILQSGCQLINQKVSAREHGHDSTTNETIDLIKYYSYRIFSFRLEFQN